MAETAVTKTVSSFFFYLNLRSWSEQGWLRFNFIHILLSQFLSEHFMKHLQLGTEVSLSLIEIRTKLSILWLNFLFIMPESSKTVFYIIVLAHLFSSFS